MKTFLLIMNRLKEKELPYADIQREVKEVVRRSVAAYEAAQWWSAVNVIRPWEEDYETFTQYWVDMVQYQAIIETYTALLEAKYDKGFGFWTHYRDFGALCTSHHISHPILRQAHLVRGSFSGGSQPVRPRKRRKKK